MDYPAGSTVVDPLVGWEAQYPALFLTWWFGSTNLQSTTMDQMRVWSPGDQGSVDIPVSDTVLFRDPISGIVYQARDYGSDKINSAALGYDVKKTIGARMLQYAQTLADQAYTVNGSVVDPITGKTFNTYDTNNPKNGAVAQKLQGYVSNIDTARKLARWITYGD